MSSDFIISPGAQLLYDTSNSSGGSSSNHSRSEYLAARQSCAAQKLDIVLVRRATLMIFYGFGRRFCAWKSNKFSDGTTAARRLRSTVPLPNSLISIYTSTIYMSGMDVCMGDCTWSSGGWNLYGAGGPRPS